MKLPGFLPPKIREARIAQSAAYRVCSVSGPIGTMRASQPSSTPLRSSCLVTLLPFTLPESRVRMFFSCSSRHDLLGDLVGRRGADDDREAGHRAVDELDAEVALDRVRDEAVVDVPGLRVLAGLQAVDVAQREVDLLGEERRHAGVERLAEVRLPEVLLRLLVQQLLGEAQADAHVAERLDLEAGHRVDHRQVERRVGELEREVLPLLGDCLLEHLVGSLVDRVSAPDGSGGDQFGHGCLLNGGLVFGGVADPPRLHACVIGSAACVDAVNCAHGKPPGFRDDPRTSSRGRHCSRNSP